MKKYDNFVANLEVLKRAEAENIENEFIVGGIIDKFFIQLELGWKVLKELLKYEGSSVANTGSPRAIIKEAYTMYDFIDEDIWLSMLRARNDMTHIYDGEQAKKLVGVILKDYIPAFVFMKNRVDELYGDSLKNGDSLKSM